MKLSTHSRVGKRERTIAVLAGQHGCWITPYLPRPIDKLAFHRIVFVIYWSGTNRLSQYPSRKLV